MKKFFLMIALLIGVKLFSLEPIQYSHPLKAEFLMLTFPKAGTNYMKKLFYLLGKELGHQRANQYNWDHFFSNHKKYWSDGMNPLFLMAAKRVPVFIVVRDLRDIVISCAHWHTKMITEHLNVGYFNFVPPRVLKEWNAMSIEDKVTSYILGDFYPQYKTLGNFVYENIENLEKYLKRIPHPVLIRYEDLVGPQGGGTLESQVDTIHRIAQAIGIELTDDEMKYLCDHLYGSRNQDQNKEFNKTFREGGIGKWKSMLTPKQMGLFEELHADFLTHYGYGIR